MTSSRPKLQGGFTLVELLVAMTVLSVALLIANSLLLESVRVFSATGRELREPAGELALRLLREDVRSAAPVSSYSGWEYGPLDCRRTDRTERWQLVGERLERRSLSPFGEDFGARPMLDRVVAFRWRVLTPGLLEVEVVRRKPAGASALRAPTSAWRSHGETLEAASVVAGSRIEIGE